MKLKIPTKLLNLLYINNKNYQYRNCRFIGNRREIGEDMGVLAGLCPANTPYFSSHPGDPQRAKL
jgi:hypothetical protein